MHNISGEWCLNNVDFKFHKKISKFFEILEIFDEIFRKTAKIEKRYRDLQSSWTYGKNHVDFEFDKKISKFFEILEIFYEISEKQRKLKNGIETCKVVERTAICGASGRFEKVAAWEAAI